jgi:hypothetical protein
MFFFGHVPRDITPEDAAKAIPLDTAGLEKNLTDAADWINRFNAVWRERQNAAAA